MQGRKVAETVVAASAVHAGKSLWGQYLVRFLTGNFPLSGEMQSFWMAIQGCMTIRSLQESQGRKLHWFHAFTLSVMAGFAGGWFGFLLMAKPSAMLYNDFNMGSCILAFVLVNGTPFDLGHKLCKTLPVAMVTVSFAQLFRSVAIPKFVHVCFEAFREQPSPYYPIPIFGPIMYATLLGNMGGFLTKGLEGHVQDGMPWPMQNGLFCATLYHFYVNDKTGLIGTALRQYLSPIATRFGLDDATLGVCFVSLFMQVVGLLQMPTFWGPTFSPFASLARWLWPAALLEPGDRPGNAATKDAPPTTSSTKRSNGIPGSGAAKKKSATTGGKAVPAPEVVANGGEGEARSGPVASHQPVSPASLKKKRKKSRKSKSKEE